MLASRQALEQCGFDPLSVRTRLNLWELRSASVLPSRHWTFLLPVVGVLIVTTAITTAVIALGAPVWIANVVVFGLLAIAAVLGLRRGWWWVLLPRHIQFIVNSDHCPSCAFSLAGLVAEDDGCVVCPECGVAWRRSEA